MTRLVCANCGGNIPGRPSRNPGQLYCSRGCQAVATRQLPIQNILQRRVVTHINRERLSLRGFAIAIGAHPHRMWEWPHKKGRGLTEQDASAIGRFFGLTTEQAITEAGGLTARDRRVAAGQRLAARRVAQIGPTELREQARRAGQGNRGKPKSPEAIANMLEARRRNGTADQIAIRLRNHSRTPEAVARHSLFLRLWHTPTPNKAQLRSWATDIGQRVGLSEQNVMHAWSSYLRARALWRTGGPIPQHEHRKWIFCDLLEELPPLPSGRLPHGWMNEYEDRVAQVEGDDAPGYAVLRRWLYREGLLPPNSTIKCDVTPVSASG